MLNDVEVRGCITIAAGANDVVIRNVRVKADCAYLILNDAGATGLKVIDSELDGNSFVQNNAAVSGTNFTLERVNVHDVGDGIKAGSGVLIKDSYLHTLNITADSHNDAIQSLDAVGLTIDHNTVMLQDGATACIILSQNSGPDWQMRDVSISRNLLAGGAYAIYGGYETGRDDPLRASDIVVSDNRISTVTFPRGGAYGALTSVDAPVVTTVGNLWADGPNSGLPL
ncbi:MAG TPA: hypothetical protein PKY70_04175 [Nakamurella multipartita]|nr:hypothetical protein [Nakamurella multipartita]